jgi:hypothetical protein
MTIGPIQLRDKVLRNIAFRGSPEPPGSKRCRACWADSRPNGASRPAVSSRTQRKLSYRKRRQPMVNQSHSKSRSHAEGRLRGFARTKRRAECTCAGSTAGAAASALTWVLQDLKPEVLERAGPAQIYGPSLPPRRDLQYPCRLLPWPARTREEGTVADSIEQARLARGGIALYGRREFARRHRCLCDGASVR